MNAQTLTPRQLFEIRVRYTIPDFQRRYVWEQEEQWEPFWEDVQYTAENYLEKLAESGGDGIAAGQNSHPHFMGAVVLKQILTSIQQIKRVEVIDGQQRMTTIQLLLDAVQHVCESLELRDEAERLSGLVLNSHLGGMNEDDVFKLWPTTGDRSAFRHAMRDGLDVDEFADSLIVQAHEYFQRRAKEWLESDLGSMQNRAQALESAVTALLQIVVIELDENEDPYIIFETLNARGTPLLESDLIKNYVMSKVGEVNREIIWGDLDDDWWSQEVTQGRLTRPRKEALFNYWLAMRNASEITANRVFTEFRKQAERSESIENLMKNVDFVFGKYRRFLEGERTSDENKYHYRVNKVMEIRAITPVFLFLLSAPNETRCQALKVLESYLVRGMLCRGGGSQGYNRLAHELTGRLQQNNLERADEVIWEFLSNQTAYNRQWPTDHDLERRLRERALYRVLTRGRLRMVLEAVEEELRADDSLIEQQDVPKNLTIEHVMPRGWKTNWPLSGGSDKEDIEETEDKRNWLIHTIGNLTLTTRPLNSSLSNAAWEEKRKTLGTHSVLFINKTLLEESKDTAWDNDFIRARSRRMAKIIAQAWPGPDSRAWRE